MDQSSQAKCQPSKVKGQTNIGQVETDAWISGHGRKRPNQDQYKRSNKWSTPATAYLPRLGTKCLATRRQAQWQELMKIGTGVYEANDTSRASTCSQPIQGFFKSFVYRKLRIYVSAKMLKPARA